MHPGFASFNLVAPDPFGTLMPDPKYQVFAALDPFFDIVRQGLAGHVDGDHYFDTIADDAVFEFRYIFPGWPQRPGIPTARLPYRLLSAGLPSRSRYMLTEAAAGAVSVLYRCT